MIDEAGKYLLVSIGSMLVVAVSLSVLIAVGSALHSHTAESGLAGDLVAAQLTLFFISLAVGFWIVKAGIPAIAVGAVVWSAPTIILRKAGMGKRRAACLATVPTLWSGVVVFWLVPWSQQNWDTRRFPSSFTDVFASPPVVTLLLAQLVACAIVGPLIAAWVYRDG